jgi:hypothetical protein
MRTLVAFLIISAGLYAQSTPCTLIPPTPTPNLQLNLIATNACNWGTYINQSSTILDNILAGFQLPHTRIGDVAVWNGTSWVMFAGNNASGANALTENASGVPSWSTFFNPSGTNTLSGTNTVTGSITPSGGGVVNANEVNGAAVPASQGCLGSNSGSQLINGTCSGTPVGAAGGELNGTFPNPGLSSWIDVKNPAYGAKGSALKITDGYMTGTPSAAILNSPTANFTATYNGQPLVGQYIEAQDGCINSEVTSTLEGTVASVISTTQLSISVNTTSMTAHGISCAAINSNQPVGTLEGALTSGATSATILVYQGQTLPATPFSAMIGSEAITVNSITTTLLGQRNGQGGQYVLNITKGGSATHAFGATMVLASTNAARPVAIGPNDNAAVQSAINAACLIANPAGSNGVQVGVYFPSSTGGYMLIAPTRLATGTNTVDSSIYSAVTGMNIPCSNLTLYGDHTAIYTSGAWSINTALSGYQLVRSYAISIGSNSVTTVNNIYIHDLNLEGMTTGNTDLGTGFPSTTTGDGWDVSSKGIFMVPNLFNNNINIWNMDIHDFKGELIYEGGSNGNILNIWNSKITNSNGDGISASNQNQSILGNYMASLGNACIENDIYPHGSHRVTSNECFFGMRGALTYANGASGLVSDADILMDSNIIQQSGLTFNSTGGALGGIQIHWTVQSTQTISGVKITNNHFRDNLYSIQVNIGANIDISGNDIVLDKLYTTNYGATVFGIDLASTGNTGAFMTGISVTHNTVTRSKNALNLGYTIQPIIISGGAAVNQPMQDSVIAYNNWLDTGGGVNNKPATSGANLDTWNLFTLQVPLYKGNSCTTTCVFNVNSGLITITSSLPTIYPLSDWLQLTETTAVSATVQTGTKIPDGFELRLTNTAAQNVTFTNDGNLYGLPGVVTLTNTQEIFLVYSTKLTGWVFKSTTGTVSATVYTVATLPATCTVGQGQTPPIAVSDATSPTYMGTLTGGGTVFTPVICKGSNTWVSH